MNVCQQGENMESLLTEATGSARISAELTSSLQSDSLPPFDTLCNAADAAFRRLTVNWQANCVFSDKLWIITLVHHVDYYKTLLQSWDDVWMRAANTAFVWLAFGQVPEWLNVFSSHPRLRDREALSKKYGTEQSRILDGGDDKISKLVPHTKFMHDFSILRCIAWKQAQRFEEGLRMRLLVVVVVVVCNQSTEISKSTACKACDWIGITLVR